MNKKTYAKEQPVWICHDCGREYGNRDCGVATWHSDTCEVCGKETSCTEPRDYGYLKPNWVNHKDRHGQQ